MKIKIAIVGTGGVGGFLGGLLARQYEHSDQVEIYFISRGAALERIQQQGLVVETRSERFVAHPFRAIEAAEADQIGPVDYLFFCTKAYDVEEGLRSVIPCIGANTVVIPFLNGVDSAERIREMLPQTEVWDGCVYVVAYIVEPGHIAEDTNGYLYLFGSRTGSPERLEQLTALFVEAGIRAKPVADIEVRVWNKFAFISTVATSTSYTDKTYGEVLSDEQDRADLLALLDEFQQVASARGKQLSPTIVKDVISQMERIPAATTTSMQRDFRAGRRTELESLTGYIVHAGEQLDVAVPTYRRMYEGLKQRL